MSRSRPDRSRSRDRRGRGVRGRLVPQTVPLARSRAAQFDDLVLDTVEDLELRWQRELDGVEFAVEDVPYLSTASADELIHGNDVLEDGNVPLARLLPARLSESGHRLPARIVLYRRPLEIRARDRSDLADLVHEVVVDQVAVLLGRDPEDIDPGH